jgi:Ca2+-binding EF-hand superfamily protein
MKPDTRLAAVMVLAAALAAPAFAQQGPQMTPEQRAARFDAADTSKDGKLDKAEFTASVPEQMRDRADQIFSMRDADSDGFITKAEYSAPMQRPQ